MDKVEINVFGVEAVKISHSQKTVFIDSFAHGIPPFQFRLSRN